MGNQLSSVSFHNRVSWGPVLVCNLEASFLSLIHTGNLHHQYSIVAKCPNAFVCPQIWTVAGVGFNPTHCFACLLHFLYMEMLILFFDPRYVFSIFFLSILSKNTVYLKQKGVSKPELIMQFCLESPFQFILFVWYIFLSQLLKVVLTLIDCFHHVFLLN